MLLDKLTLHAQLALLEQNAKSLDEAIAAKLQHLQEAATDLEQTRGARGYHGLLVQQIQGQITEIERAEKASPTPAAAPVAA